MSTQINFTDSDKKRYALIERGTAWLNEVARYTPDQYIGRTCYTLTTEEVDKLYAAMHADEEAQS